jgi:hypothetical protein
MVGNMPCAGEFVRHG